MDGGMVSVVGTASALAAYVGGRVLDAAVDKFAATVIHHCAERREEGHTGLDGMKEAAE